MPAMQRLPRFSGGTRPADVSGRLVRSSLPSDGASLRATFQGARAAVALALVVAVAVNAAIAWHASYTVEGLQNSDFQLVRQALILEGEVPELLSNARGYLLTRDPEFLARFAKDREDAREALAQLGDLVWTSEGRALVDVVSVELEDVVSRAERELELLGQSRLEEARAELVGARALQDELSATLDALVIREEILLRARLDELHRERLLRPTIGTLLLAVAGALVMRVLARSQHALESAQRRRQALAEFAHPVVAALSQSALFEEAVAIIARTLKVDFCTVLELLPDGRALMPRATAGQARSAGNHETVEVESDALAERVLATGRPLTMEDLPEQTRGNARLPREHQLRSGIGVPIRVQGRQFGVLSAYTARRRTFTAGETYFLQAVAHEVTFAVERKRAEEALLHQAQDDALTDLPNRVLLQDRLEQALLTARRGNEPLALLVMDLNRFKDVNDSLGHQYGDVLLQQVARRLRDVLRASDTVARLGGDEFAVLLPGSDAIGAMLVAGKLLETLESPQSRPPGRRRRGRGQGDPGPAGRPRLQRGPGLLPGPPAAGGRPGTLAGRVDLEARARGRTHLGPAEPPGNSRLASG